MGNRLPPTHDHPQAHPTPAPADKRESRTLHQDPAHRMGPRPPLPLKRAAPKRPKLLPQPLQPTTPTPRPQRANTTPTAVNNLPGTHTWFGSVTRVRVRAMRVVNHVGRDLPTRAAARNSQPRFKDRTWFGSVSHVRVPCDARRRPSAEPGSRVPSRGSAFRDHFQTPHADAPQRGALASGV